MQVRGYPGRPGLKRQTVSKWLNSLPSEQEAWQQTHTHISMSFHDIRGSQTGPRGPHHTAIVFVFEEMHSFIRCTVPWPGGGALWWRATCSSPPQVEIPRLVWPCRIRPVWTQHQTSYTKGQRGGSCLRQPPRHRSPAWNTWGVTDGQAGTRGTQCTSSSVQRCMSVSQWGSSLVT